AVVVLVVLANDHLIMITAHFPLFFLKIRHFFYRYQLVDPKDPTYNYTVSSTRSLRHRANCSTLFSPIAASTVRFSSVGCVP
ncbi:MAG: hypothetical protein ACRC5A_16950, partial [Enterobacteriaceae bacterium]